MSVQSSQAGADPTAKVVQTTCPYCGVGCGVSVSLRPGDAIEVHGDQTHPANLGRLCSKGTALAETLDLDGRLLYPEVDGEQVGWDAALGAVGKRLRDLIDRYGPDSVAFYVSGQLLTEDYYVANKLMKGFIGSANIDTNSRLCMSSAVAAYKRAFGSDTVPNSYQDIEQADLVVVTGSNLAWCHPVLYQRLLAAKRDRPELKTVVIDPRRTATCDGADLHLALRSGTDSILFAGLFNWLYEQGHVDEPFVHEHTYGLEDTLRAAQQHASSVEAVAEQCGLKIEDTQCFFELFAQTARVVTLFSQGINQSSSGTDKGNAIINCHLLSGRIGRAGMGPFSITGQPNAMGGREVGGLSNQLAAHMDIGNPQHRDLVGRFWQTNNLASGPGLKAVDLFRAIEDGSVKAVWIMATNPAVSLPDSSRVRRALEKCECVVVSDCVTGTDTLEYADIRLPALAWGEKEGTVTNSERRISRQRAFLPAPGEARPDWWIICEVAKRLGYHGFDYSGIHEIFTEHARLSGFENAGRRDFDISALASLDQDGYAQLSPVLWPCPAEDGRSERLFADGLFFTANGRARMVPVTPRPPARCVDKFHDLVLNTGRSRDHWHTMTRTAKSPRLSAHTGEPFVALHPEDAEANDVEDGQLATVKGLVGQALLRVRTSDAQPRGQVFAPIHWNDQFASAARIGSLVTPDVDPVSGQPEFKHSPVHVEPYPARWYGFLLARRVLQLLAATYWAKSRRRVVWHYEIAGDASPENWARTAREQLGKDVAGAQWLELHDSTQLQYRAARIVDGRLDAVLIISPDHDLPARDWLVGLFERERLEDADRMHLLRGTPPSGQQDVGAIVCSCFSVGVNTLTRAISDQGLETPEALGEALSAGTNCGSCLPELRRLITDVRQADQDGRSSTG